MTQVAPPADPMPPVHTAPSRTPPKLVHPSSVRVEDAKRALEEVMRRCGIKPGSQADSCMNAAPLAERPDRAKILLMLLLRDASRPKIEAQSSRPTSRPCTPSSEVASSSNGSVMTGYSSNASRASTSSFGSESSYGAPVPERSPRGSPCSCCSSLASPTHAQLLSQIEPDPREQAAKARGAAARSSSSRSPGRSRSFGGRKRVRWRTLGSGKVHAPLGVGSP